MPILLHEPKPTLGLFCLHLNTVGRSGHVTSTIHRVNLLGFKSLWLGFRIRDNSQGLVFSVRVYPAVHLMQWFPNCGTGTTSGRPT